MFAQLGTHVFKGLKAPANWSESHSIKVGRIPRVNTKDALQKTGDELMEINLTIRYESVFCEPADEVAALKKSMGAGEMLPFISGKGVVFGNFIITGVDVTNEAYTPAGVLETATVSVKLLEYPTDKATATPGKEKDAPVGEALKSTAPPIQQPMPLTLSATPAGEITTKLSKAKDAVNKIKATVKKVQKGITTVKKGVQDVKKLAADAKQLYTNVKTKVEATKKIIQRVKELPTSLSGAIKYAENLSSLSNTADLSVLEMNVKELSDSADKVSKHATGVASFVATREGGK